MEEPICEVHPFSYSSPSISNEAKQENLVYAMGESVSFGRFTSESLSWEKWSTFNRNRYVEEAEKYSRPGSVKQKRAFLEAHFKKVTTLKDVTNSPDHTIQEGSTEPELGGTSIRNNHNEPSMNAEKRVETVEIGVNQSEDNTNHDTQVGSDQEELKQPSDLTDAVKQNPVTETLCGLGKTEEFSSQSCSINQEDSASLPALIKRNPPLSSYIPSVEAGTPEVNPVKEMNNKYCLDEPNKKKKIPLYKSINRKLSKLVSPVIKQIGISSKGSKKRPLDTHKVFSLLFFMQNFPSLAHYFLNHHIYRKRQKTDYVKTFAWDPSSNPIHSGRKRPKQGPTISKLTV